MKHAGLYDVTRANYLSDEFSDEDWRNIGPTKRRMVSKPLDDHASELRHEARKERKVPFCVLLTH